MTTPAAALGSAVDALVQVSWQGLPAAALQEQIALVAPQVGRLEGWVQGASAQLSAVCGGELPTGDGAKRSVAGWLAEVRHSTGAAAGRDLRSSLALRRALPLVVDAVLDGVLTPEQAAVLSRLVGRIGDAELAGCQEQLIEVAAGRDPVSLAGWVRHQIATHCEPELEADAERGRAKRYLQTSREADGTVRGRFVLAGEDAEPVLTVIEATARRQGLADERSAGQRRADALVEMAEQVLRHGELPEHRGQRPQLSYVLSADCAAA